MISKTIKIIHKLRVFFLLFISLMFMIELGINPIDTSTFMGARFGSAIGMSVSVPENPISKLAIELKQKKASLDEREKKLDNRELSLLEEKKKETDWILWSMGGGIIILFILILTNFYLDFMNRLRKKKDELIK